MVPKRINKAEESSFIRQIFQSEITWIITVLAIGWGVITTVILPIQKLQLELADIQSTQQSELQNYQQLTVDDQNEKQDKIQEDDDIAALQISVQGLLSEKK